MFGKKSVDEVAQEEKIERLKARVESLETEKKGLNEDVERLKLKKKIEDEDIKHMVKMKEEKQAIELEKEKLKLSKEKDDAIAAVKDAYRDKMEERLETEVTNMKEMYTQILERLPNVTARLKGEV